MLIPLLESGVEVCRAANVVVQHGRWRSFRNGQRLILEMVIEDGLDTVGRVGAEGQRPRCGCFQTLGGMFAAQAHQTETRAISHFRMWLGSQNLAEQFRSV